MYYLSNPRPRSVEDEGKKLTEEAEAQEYIRTSIPLGSTV